MNHWMQICSWKDLERFGERIGVGANPRDALKGMVKEGKAMIVVGRIRHNSQPCGNPSRVLQ